MKSLRLLALAATLALSSQAADPPRVSVTFGDQSAFSDLRTSTLSTPRER